jgi:hypothetical protein
MSSQDQSSSGGIGFLGLLTILFVVLKLTGAINWSWLWVLSPLWIPLLVLGISAVIIISILVYKEVERNLEFNRINGRKDV